MPVDSLGKRCLIYIFRIILRNTTEEYFCYVNPYVNPILLRGTRYDDK